MGATSPFDIHADLFRAAFQAAVPVAGFMASGKPAHSEKWAAYAARVALSAEQQTRVSSFKRKMHILVVAGMWCGDCARQGPMIASIASATSVIDLRFIDNEANVQLRDELRIHGASRVPVVLTLSEDFLEVGRYGDRTLSAYRRKTTQELGDACDAGIVPPSPEELQVEVSEWLDVFERQQLLLRVSPMLRARHGD
jgi:hypothetical protein